MIKSPLSENSSDVTNALVENLTPDGTPPPSRIKDAKSLHSIFIKLQESDRVNARNRAEIDAMFSGKAPYDEEMLRQAGMGTRCNLNFGEADGLLESALAGYVDLVNSVETLIRVSVRGVDPQKKEDYEQIIAEGFTKMLRDWDEFNFKHILNSTYLIKHGISVSLWEDEFDWRWQVAKIGDFLLPNRTFASEEQVEVAISPRTMRGHELYSFIKQPEIAEDMGWDLEETKKAILTNSGSQQAYQLTDWERYQEDLANNDLFVSLGAGSEVRVIHAWVKEFDGTLSHYISLADGSNEKFLYQKRSRFRRACDAFVIFTYGVGNGYYQSIRGLGKKIFPAIQVSNRMRCQLIDGTMLSTSLLIQPDSEDSLENLAFEYLGPFSVLNSGVNIIDKQLPNMGQNAIPVLQDMSEQLQRRAGAYRAPSNSANSKEKTKFEVQAQLQGDARLTTGAMSLFYNPFDRLLRGAFRRATREDYLTAERGGEQAHAFWKYCTERGVPLSVLQNNVEEVSAVRAVGSGSDQLRLVAFDEFMQMMSQFDTQGQQNLLRDRVAARVGYDHVDRYVPSKPNSRPVIDEKIAELENSALLAGNQVNVQPNENHLVHCTVHAPSLQQVSQAVQQGQMDPQVAVKYGQLAIPHFTAHLEQLASDESHKQQYGDFKKISQQAGAIFEQQSEKLQAAQRRQQEAAQQPQAPAAPAPEAGPSPELSAKLQEHQADMQMNQERHQQKLTLDAAEAKQKMAIRDAEMATKIRNASTP